MEETFRALKHVQLYHDWCESEQDIYTVIKNLTIKGIFKYGFQLVSFNSYINISII